MHRRRRRQDFALSRACSHPAGAGFEEAACSHPEPGCDRPGGRAAGAEIKASFEFHAVVQVHVECEITVERTASGCRPPTPPSAGPTPALRPPTRPTAGRRRRVSTLHPSRERWRVTVPIPLPGRVGSVMTDSAPATGPLAGVRRPRPFAACWPGRGRRRSWPTSGAEVIKVERPGAGDDTRALGPALHHRDGRRRRATPPTTSPPTATRSRSPSTWPRPKGADLVRELAGPCDVVVENFKTGGLPEVRPRLRQPVGGQPAAGLLLDHRLRPGRARRRTRRLRLHDPGHGRPDVDHRPARRRAGRRADEGRRRRGRPVHRPLRLQRHPRRPAARARHGAGPAHRHGPVRRPGRHAGQPGDQLLRLGQGARRGWATPTPTWRPTSPSHARTAWW